MNSPLTFPFGFFVNDNTPDSGRYFNRLTKRPYADMAEALEILTVGIRHEGLTINIAGTDYWWPSDDPDLTKDPVVKINPGIIIEKSGADVNSNGDIYLSDESNIPDWKTPSVWVNNISGTYQTQFNRITKIISGLYGVQPGDTITIVF